MHCCLVKTLEFGGTFPCVFAEACWGQHRGSLRVFGQALTAQPRRILQQRILLRLQRSPDEYFYPTGVRSILIASLSFPLRSAQAPWLGYSFSGQERSFRL